MVKRGTPVPSLIGKLKIPYAVEWLSLHPWLSLCTVTRQSTGRTDLLCQHEDPTQPNKFFFFFLMSTPVSGPGARRWFCWASEFRMWVLFWLSWDVTGKMDDSVPLIHSTAYWFYMSSMYIVCLHHYREKQEVRVVIPLLQPHPMLGPMGSHWFLHLELGQCNLIRLTGNRQQLQCAATSAGFHFTEGRVISILMYIPFSCFI